MPGFNVVSNDRLRRLVQTEVGTIARVHVNMVPENEFQRTLYDGMCDSGRIINRAPYAAETGNVRVLERGDRVLFTPVQGGIWVVSAVLTDEDPSIQNRNGNLVNGKGMIHDSSGQTTIITRGFFVLPSKDDGSKGDEYYNNLNDLLSVDLTGAMQEIEEVVSVYYAKKTTKKVSFAESGDFSFAISAVAAAVAVGNLIAKFQSVIVAVTSSVMVVYSLRNALTELPSSDEIVERIIDGIKMIPLGPVPIPTEIKDAAIEAIKSSLEAVL